LYPISQCKLTNARDSQIWDYAKLQGFCVVTHDDDFDDIYALNGFPPKIIKLKTGNLSNQQTIEILTRNKYVIYDFLTNVDEGFLTFYSL
jgi:predicted nuclease of predicted toxin-antitoxin system